MHLTCRDLCISLSNHTILHNVNVQLTPGVLTALVGPNGAGKSTLLRALCGDLEPTQGAVFWDERNLRNIPVMHRALMRAVVPQHSSLAFDFSVEDVAAMGWIPRSGQRGLSDALQWALSRVGLQDKAHRRYTTLSGGEKQRTHIARALVQLGGIHEAQKGAILLDEPTASLDPASAYDILHTLRALADAGTTVFVLLHDLNLASLFADRVLVLSRGVLVEDGTPQQVFTQTMMQTVYGTPARVVEHPTCGRPMILPPNPNAFTAKELR